MTFLILPFTSNAMSIEEKIFQLEVEIVKSEGQVKEELEEKLLTLQAEQLELEQLELEQLELEQLDEMEKDVKIFVLYFTIFSFGLLGASALSLK